MERVGEARTRVSAMRLRACLRRWGNTLSALLTLAESVFGDGGDSEVEADLLVRECGFPLCLYSRNAFRGFFL